MDEQNGDAFYAAAYWGARNESAESCAARLQRFLGALSSVHPSLRRWLKVADSPAAVTSAPAGSDNELNTLRDLFLAGRTRRDLDDEVMTELGYGVSLWNGDPNGAALSISCGTHVGGARLGNSVVLQLPDLDNASAELFTTGTARLLMLALIECWEPLWAVFASYGMLDAQDTEPGPHEPVAGWMTFVSQLAGPPATGRDEPPASFTMEPADSGFLITIGDSPGRVSPSELALVQGLLPRAL
jgi:immunity protein 52 of polymorphic toxin system